MIWNSWKRGSENIQEYKILNHVSKKIFNNSLSILCSWKYWKHIPCWKAVPCYTCVPCKTCSHKINSNLSYSVINQSKRYINGVIKGSPTGRKISIFNLEITKTSIDERPTDRLWQPRVVRPTSSEPHGNEAPPHFGCSLSSLQEINKNRATNHSANRNRATNISFSQWWAPQDWKLSHSFWIAINAIK